MHQIQIPSKLKAADNFFIVLVALYLPHNIAPNNESCTPANPIIINHFGFILYSY